MELSISVIIPTYNRKAKLSQCLGSLFKQAYPKDNYEIIVVDDGSDDDTERTIQELRSYSPCALRYFKQNNKGPAVARNKGIREAQSEIIFFTGDDCVAHPDLLQEHAAVYKNYGKNLAVLGFTEWHKDTPDTPFMRFLSRSSFQFDYDSIKDSEWVDFFHTYTTNFSLPKNILEEVGLFDEQFPYAAFEDVELGYRLKLQDVLTRYNKNAIAYHCHPMSFEKYCIRQENAGLSSVIFFKKHPELKKCLGIKYNQLHLARFRFALWFFRKSGNENANNEKIFRLSLLYHYHKGINEALKKFASE